MSDTALNLPPGDSNRVLTRSRVIGFAVLMLTMAAVTLLIWPESVRNIGTSSYLPHAFCYLQQPRLVWLHVTSDLLIGFSYVAISLMLAVLVHRARKDIPFSWVFLAFGLFIVSCGGTHFMEVLTVWHPFYWLAGDVKLITAVASVATAIALPPLIPRTVAMVQQAKESAERKRRLEVAHGELEEVYSKLKNFDNMKTQFFANVSHELRTPLTLILGPTEKLLRSPHLNQAERQSIEMVHRNARVLLSHVNDLLDISKFDAGKLQLSYVEVDLARLIRLCGAYFESLSHDRDLTFHITAPAVLEAQVDPDKIQRVLLNLLSNAFKYTPEKGDISLVLSVRGQDAEITVSDNGPGIPAHQREHIFERFGQADNTLRGPGGSGLGLAIVRDFVTMHQGKVDVTESDSGGALFRVEIPLRAPAGVSLKPGPSDLQSEVLEETVKPDAGRVIAHTRTVNASQPLVLVVEDNPDMSRFTEEALSTHYRVITASNGREGLEQALAMRPDAIVSDVMMPGMSGEELVTQLRKSPLSNVPVILLSARADEGLRVRMLREGVQDYLLKPFSPEELLARVGNVVATKRVRDMLQHQLETQDHSIEGLAEQITARNRDLISASEGLRRSEVRFRRLFESNIVGIMQTDVSGRIIDANPAFLAMLGRARGDLEAGRISWVDITPPEYAQADAAAVQQLLSTGSFTPWEKEYIRSDGARVPVLIGGALLEPGGSECIVFVVDLTERKRTEGALRNSEKLATIGRLAGTIAHEINNPLDAVTNLLYLLASDSSIGAESRRYVALANDEVNRVSHISKQMLGFYREAPEPVPVSPSSVIDTVFSLYDRKIQQQNMRIVRDYRFTGEIAGYPGEMRQVFSNLIVNAIDASSVNGLLRVRVRKIRNWRTGEDGVRITVCDKGSGIAPECRSQIFEPFFTTKGEKGTGLGLWVTNGIIQKHGGFIRVRSSVRPQASGTCFSIFLPVSLNPRPDA